jgi:hypothetical protein
MVVSLSLILIGLTFAFLTRAISGRESWADERQRRIVRLTGAILALMFACPGAALLVFGLLQLLGVVAPG